MLKVARTCFWWILPEVRRLDLDPGFIRKEIRFLGGES